MKSTLFARLLILLLITFILSSCLMVPFDEGNHRGGYHEGGHGEEHHGDRH